MSASDLIRTAFDQGYSAGERDRPRRANPYMPHTQADKWAAWNLGYEEAQPKYVAASRSKTGA